LVVVRFAMRDAVVWRAAEPREDLAASRTLPTALRAAAREGAPTVFGFFTRERGDPREEHAMSRRARQRREGRSRAPLPSVVQCLQFGV